MAKQFESQEHIEQLAELKRVRAEAIAHFLAAKQMAQQRRRLIDALIADGFSQADLARELGVTRQAIQKMIAAGR